MEKELIMPTRKLGNSSGVLLPREWKDSLVKIVKIKNLPSDIQLLNIINKNVPLERIEGVYLIGSYAREEEDIDSDIDLLIITNNKTKESLIKIDNFEINIISENELQKQLKINALPVLSWIKEARPIINSGLIDKYRKYSVNYKNTKWHIETTKTAIDVITEKIKLAKIKENISYLNGCAYSLVLRLRVLYAIECLVNNKKWSNKELRNMLIKISGTDRAYNIYKKNKRGEEEKSYISIKEAQKLVDYITNKNSEIERWLKEIRG